jgi:hypothetical protein
MESPRNILNGRTEGLERKTLGKNVVTAPGTLNVRVKVLFIRCPFVKKITS